MNYILSTESTGSLFGALISGLVAIVIFLIGNLVEKKKLKDRAIKEIVEFKEFFFQNISSIIIIIDSQITRISENIENIKRPGNLDLSIEFLPELDILDLFKMNQEKIFKIIVRHRKGDLNNKITDLLNLRKAFYNIDACKKFISKTNIEVIKSRDISINLFNDKQHEISSLYNKFSLEYNQNEESKTDDFLKEFHSVIIIKQREIIEQGGNIDKIFKEIIFPLKKYIEDNPASKDSRVIMITDPVMYITKAYLEIRSIRDYTIKQAETFKENLRDIKKLLEESINHTKSRKENYD